MNINFIIPSWHYFDDPFKLQPYWELYYATILKKKLNNDANIVFTDLRGKSKTNVNFSETLNEIQESDYYLYWIMKSGDANEVYSIVKYLKDKYPNSKHIAGGTHVDMVKEECQKVFDSIIIGPGENSFFKAIKEGNKIYSEDYKNVPFSKTDFPDRSFLPKDSVISNQMFKQYGNYDATMVYFSRGCFYKCAYCVYNVPNTLQAKDKENIEKEISYLKETYKIQAILLKDEIALNPNKKIFYPQMDAIGKSNINWRGQTTSVGTKEQLKLAKETGCVELSVGIETVDNNVMKFIDKTWQSEKMISNFISNAKEIGINIKVCLILGLPGEPKNIVEKTINFIDKNNIDYVSLSGFCPMPGSPIYRNPEKYDIEFIDKNWDKHAHLLYRFSETEHVGLPFRYKKETQWGSSFSREMIINNIREVQEWLSNRSMTY